MKRMICERCGHECERYAPDQKYCRDCSAEIVRGWRVTKAKIKSKGKIKCARCGKEIEQYTHNKKYCFECVADRSREYVNGWRRAHPEKYREYKKRYQAAHREEINARRKAKRIRKYMQERAAVI